MARIGRSARGIQVDFDLLSIKQQLASAPVPVTVNQRRQFIDDREGVKRESYIVAPAPVHSALQVDAPEARTSASDAAARAQALAESLSQ